MGEQLDAHRKRQQAQYDTLTLTDLYNVVEKLRQSDGSAGELLTAKDQAINQQGLASVVLSLHQQLDTAVADAYGWPDNLPDRSDGPQEILTRLVALNRQRVQEEQAGQIRYLRPSYQNRTGGPPGQQQLGIDLGATGTVKPTTSTVTQAQDWPKELAGQMQAIRNLVQQSPEPITARQVAGQFQKVATDKVQPLLDTLTALALLRLTPNGRYAA